MNRPVGMKLVLPDVGRHREKRFDLRVVSRLLDSPLNGVSGVVTSKVGVSEYFPVVDNGLRGGKGEEKESAMKRRQGSRVESSMATKHGEYESDDQCT